jgi:hypothetical protein
VCARDSEIESCVPPADFEEQVEISRKEFFSGAETRSKVLMALQKEALDTAELYGTRASKYAGKSKILVSIYDEARQEILKSDYLSELKVALEANSSSSEAHSQFQKLSQLVAQYEAARKLPLAERKEVRAKLLEEYNIAHNLIQRFWTFATHPSENIPRLRPTVVPVAESSRIDLPETLALTNYYLLIPQDIEAPYTSTAAINLIEDRKFLEALVLDSNGRENPVRIDEKKAGVFERLKLDYDAASRTVTHRYSYSRNGRVKPSTKAMRIHLKEFLGVK